MTAFVEEDDDVVTTAWEVLRGDLPEGTENVRLATNDDDEVTFVYRIDVDARTDEPVEAEAVDEDGEFPHADATCWHVPPETVANEVERRYLGPATQTARGPAVGDSGE